MDTRFVAPVAPCHATGACLAEKSPLTNRIRRQFARIKAVRTGRCRSWLPWEREVSGRIRRPAGHATRHAQDSSKGESQNTSKKTVRTFRSESEETSGPWAGAH